jgi:hypothetical protein
MMNPATPAMRNLAAWLLAQEAVAGNPSEMEMYTTFRVCDKLRRSLSTLVGAKGYRSLISRALTLAKKEAPSLGKVQVKEDGSLEWTGAVDELQQGMDEAAKGGAVLVVQLLGLLVAFIGLAATLRLVRYLWPDAPFEGMNSKTEKGL